MTSLIYLAATANLIAAGIDSASTIKHLTPGMELNPLATRLMRWLGMRPAVYACFALIACVTLSATAACLAIDSTALTALCASSLPCTFLSTALCFAWVQYCGLRKPQRSAILEESCGR